MSTEVKLIINLINLSRNHLANTNGKFLKSFPELLNEITIILEFLREYKFHNLTSGSNIGIEDMELQIIDNIKSSLRPLAESVEEITKKHKDVFNMISVSLESNKKIFPFKLDRICSGNLAKGEARASINRVLVNHFLICGKPDLAQTLAKEFEIDLCENLLMQYRLVNEISDHLLNRDVGMLIAWIEQNSEYLYVIDSKLHILLNKLELNELLFQDRTEEFVARCKDYMMSRCDLTPYIRELMSLAITRSPMMEVNIISNIWEEIYTEFRRSANLMLQRKQQSPLIPILQVGIRVMEPLLDYIHIYETTQQRYNGDTLPIDFKLDPRLQHHSIYICNVLNEQCTPMNPPMRLKCGHLVSVIGVINIITLASTSIECPCCLTVTKMRDLLKIKLL